MQDEGAEEISLALGGNNSLVHLNISSNNLSHRGAKYIFNALSTNESLYCLNIGNSAKCIYKNIISPIGAKSLTKCLAINQVLVALNLKSTRLENEGIHYISEGLKFNSILQDLNISGNLIDSGGVVYITRIMIQCKGLTRFNLSDNPLGDIFLCSVIDIVHNAIGLEKKDKSNVKELSIANCAFGDLYLNHFFRALRRLCQTLHALRLNKNNLFTKGRFSEIQSLLVQNIPFRSLNLSACSMNDRNLHFITNELVQSKSYLTVIKLKSNRISVSKYIYIYVYVYIV